MTKLFVGGLPYTSTSEELKNLFTPVGAVLSATVIIDKFTGQSKGFGFVEMENDTEAQTAINQLNGTEVGGRSIIVSVARPKEDRPSRDRFSGGNSFRGGFDNNRQGSGGRDRGGRR